MNDTKAITLLENLLDEVPLTNMKRAQAKAWLNSLQQALSKAGEVQGQVDELKQQIEKLKENGKE